MENSYYNEDDFILIKQQISNHPNFDLQPIERFVIINDIRFNTKNDDNRGLFISYHIEHYNKGTLDKSFVKTTNLWEIVDSDKISVRNFTTNEKLINPLYEDFLRRNQLPKEILNPDYSENNSEVMPNPNYLDEETFKKIKQFIPNPEFISLDETPNVTELISNPEYEIAVVKISEPKFIVNPNFKPNNNPTIPNPDYINDITLLTIDKFIKEPAFTYIMRVLKKTPAILFSLLSLYIQEQDDDNFFNKY